MPVGFGRVGDVRITRVGVTMQSTVKSCFSSSRPSSSDVTCGRGCFQKQTAGEQQLQPVQTCESLTLVTTSVFSVTAPISRSMPARRSLARLRREGGDRRLQRATHTPYSSSANPSPLPMRAPVLGQTATEPTMIKSTTRSLASTPSGLPYLAAPATAVSGKRRGVCVAHTCRC